MLLWGNPLFHFTSLSVFEEQEFQCVETAYILSGCEMCIRDRYISLLAADKRNHGPHQDNEEGAMQQQYGKPPP